MSKLIGKIILTGLIETKTGLHIGGSKSSYEIGGVDLNVVKTANGQPYIPGSSLKGKLRSMLAKKEGHTDIKYDDLYIREIFGHVDTNDKEKSQITRLLVRDAFLDINDYEARYPEEKRRTEFEYSDVKWETQIDRSKGTARDPRQMERVPEGCRFEYELIYNLMEDTEKIPQKLSDHLDALYLALQLLQDDYIGGQGSRGYGKVSFVAPVMQVKMIEGKKYKTIAADQWAAAVKTFSANLSALVQ